VCQDSRAARVLSTSRAVASGYTNYYKAKQYNEVPQRSVGHGTNLRNFNWTKDGDRFLYRSLLEEQGK
jgi:hypothetical protein